MEARHLARYRLFLRVGAMSLRRDSPRGAYADLEAARAELMPGVAVWMFPQGARRPAAEPVSGCERGAAHLALAAAAAGAVRICPVAFRYVFRGEQRPEAFAFTGAPWTVEPRAGPGRHALADRIERRLGETVASLDRRLAAESLDGFRPLVAGSLSANKKMDRFRHAIGLLPGEFDPRNG